MARGNLALLYRQRRIVWAVRCDHNGVNCYRRPIVILSATADIQDKDDFLGIVSSNTAALVSPRPHYLIEITSDPNGNCESELVKETVACCDWPTRVLRTEVEGFSGLVPEDEMRSIITKCLTMPWATANC
jgi:hypothetical protein